MVRGQQARPALFEPFFYPFFFSPSGGIGVVFFYVCFLMWPKNSPFHVF